MPRSWRWIPSHWCPRAAGRGGKGGSAGLRPAPAEAVVPAAGRQPQRQQPKRQQQLGFRGVAERCGLAGHAVNPSLGARWRHPWRQRSCQPTPPRL
ncbi:hypothetical protein CR918_17590 [Stenotrophomonas indicatrix]|nr:hypothetical protein CR918_17590 [Stenotrophomonas indicatrix]